MREFVKSPLFFDNLKFSKDFLLIDDGQGSLNYYNNRTGGGVAITTQTYAAKNCLKGIELATRDVGATSGDFALFSQWLDNVDNKKICFSFDFCMPDISDLDRFEVRFYNLNDTYYWKSVVYFDVDEDCISLHNSSNGFTALTESSLNVLDNVWYHCEILLDFFSNKYISVLFNGILFDGSNVSFYDVQNPTNFGSNFRFMIVNSGNLQAKIYIDNFSIRLFDV